MTTEITNICYFCRHPFAVILFCVIFAGISSLPYILDFKEEKDQLELWVPRNSEYYDNSKWIRANYPSKSRWSQVLLTTTYENILTVENIRKLFHIHAMINSLESENGTRYYEDICSQWPKRGTENRKCREGSILELWAVNGDYEGTNQTLLQKTSDEIMSDINTIKLSGISGLPVNLNGYLGSINKTSDIVESARALQMSFPADLARPGSTVEKSEEFEQEFIYFLDNYSSQITNDPVSVQYFCQKSFSDAIGGTIRGDLKFLSMGFIIVFIYIMLMLGKFNSVEQRAYLSLLGVVAILLGTAVSYGVCQLFGVWYGPMNSILPFMLLGIGIDDMFVIVQGLTNIQKDVDLKR